MMISMSALCIQKKKKKVIEVNTVNAVRNAFTILKLNETADAIKGKFNSCIYLISYQ